MITCTWRGRFSNAEVQALHAEGFGTPGHQRDWQSQAEHHSLGWVCARDGSELAGFVNVAWDGGLHAFLLDTVVAIRLRHQGVGSGLVATAVHETRLAGCAWLHVDFVNDLRRFYLETCGFRATSAGIIAL
jgi:Acetyltransferase (GNAT) family